MGWRGRGRERGKEGGRGKEGQTKRTKGLIEKGERRNGGMRHRNRGRREEEGGKEERQEEGEQAEGAQRGLRGITGGGSTRRRHGGLALASSALTSAHRCPGSPSSPPCPLGSHSTHPQ